MCIVTGQERVSRFDIAAVTLWRIHSGAAVLIVFDLINPAKQTVVGNKQVGTHAALYSSYSVYVK